MTEIRNIRVYGMEDTAYRSGFPMRTNPPINNYVDSDMNRLATLSKAPSGSGHDNALKGILVQFDLKYPQYFTPQLQRYHWIDIISSQSKMHCLTKGAFAYNKYVVKEIGDLMDEYIEAYNESPSYENFMTCISNCPMGLEMWMGISTNYLQLKTIYKQRKCHKLKEDWGAFCSMIESLPNSYLITGECE